MTHITYLLFNLCVVIIPFLCSFTRRYPFHTYWKNVLVSILPIATLFILWDCLVIGKHWWFNPLYITGITLAHIPIEEILFFFSVPYACLFVWYVLTRKMKTAPSTPAASLPYWLSICLVMCAELLAILGKGYTALVLLAVVLLSTLIRLLKRPQIKRRAFIPFVGFILFATFICNGFLTALPITIYDPTYQLGIRIWTTPIEDFVYGLVLILGVIMIFEYQVQSVSLSRRP